MYAAGETISTAIIRQRFGVSRATAKRDMRDIRALLAGRATRRRVKAERRAYFVRPARTVLGVAMGKE